MKFSFVSKLPYSPPPPPPLFFNLKFKKILKQDGFLKLVSIGILVNWLG